MNGPFFMSAWNRFQYFDKNSVTRFTACYSFNGLFQDEEKKDDSKDGAQARTFFFCKVFLLDRFSLQRGDYGEVKF